MGAWLRWLCVLAVAGLIAFWWLTRPEPLAAAALDGIEGDPQAGERVFHAAGCAACHVAPDAEDRENGDGLPVLAGGQRFPSPFGTFIAPNISSDPVHGIGGWSDAEVLNAIARGVSPDGSHYYPAFPYAAYAKAPLGDLADLIAYLRTLPASQKPDQPHEVGFPFSIRRGLGLWKALFLRDDWVLEGDLPPEVARGRMLVEGLGHCAQCHTPRNFAGGLIREDWLAGAENPVGDGRIPGIDPGSLTWSKTDIAAYLETGLTPDFDSAGGEMVAVIEELGQLPDSDRAAIAAYLKAIPAQEDAE